MVNRADTKIRSQKRVYPDENKTYGSPIDYSYPFIEYPNYAYLVYVWKDNKLLGWHKFILGSLLNCDVIVRYWIFCVSIYFEYCFVSVSITLYSLSRPIQYGLSRINLERHRLCKQWTDVSWEIEDEEICSIPSWNCASQFNEFKVFVIFVIWFWLHCNLKVNEPSHELHHMNVILA